MFHILEIKIPQLNYHFSPKENTSEVVNIRVNYTVSISNHNNDKALKCCELDFDLSIIDDNEEPIIIGDYKIIYQVFIKTDFTDEDIIEKEILRHLEPYVKKGVFEFCINNDIPPINLPYEFWKYAKNQNL